jgi:formamidopyrimidine-DNA glycosylase
MPELPEVEVVRRGLSDRIAGNTITEVSAGDVSLRRPIPLHAMRHYTIGATIEQVRRRAKYLLIDLDNGAVLIIHLGMTGKLGLFAGTTAPLRHDHITWIFADGRHLRFNDSRRFGSIFLLHGENVAQQERDFFSAAGVEPFSDQFDGRYLRKRAKNRIVPVKNFIMDGRIVSGVGNIYANESLFLAGIRPTRPAGAISLVRWQRLADAIRAVLAEAISQGGSTISNFFGVDGNGGYFQLAFCVYGKAGHPCPHCTRPIKRIVLAGRATYYCTRCQR